MLAALLLGGVYALVAPMGLPYDEPSHQDYVEHLVAHGSLPVLGDPGVTYEAQQGPVAYVGYATVGRLAGLVGVPGLGQAYAERLVGLAWLVMCVVLARRLVLRALPSWETGTVTAAVALAYLNPMVVADAASLQNDLPSLALALLALDVGTRSDRPRPSAWSGAWSAGLALGLSLLTKLTTWPVAVVLFLWTWRRRSPADAVRLTVGATAVFGWWPVRNYLAYVDVTGAGAVQRAGVHFEPSGWHGLDTLIELVRAAVTFLWLPVEYYRNTFRAPLLIEALVLLATIAIALGAATVYRCPSPEAGVLGVIALAGVLAWAVITTGVEGASFRIAYVALPAWAACAAATLHRARPWGVLSAIALLGVLHAWTVAQLLEVGLAGRRGVG